MLSITNISAEQASHYYEKDDYYAKDSLEHKESSRWFGKGAATLGLNGQVKKDDFVAMLQGKLPTGQQLGRLVGGKLEHAAGIDMTFSAPKSVSILSLIKGDKSLIEAHNEAVMTALKYAEKNFINTRIKVNGEVIKEKVDNFIIAMFQHNTSRAHDPNLHTHCPLMNAVQSSDGKWRSAEFRGPFENKINLGLVYRSDFALRVQNLGHRIRHTGPGLFEIDGISDEVLRHFSKRSIAKEEALKTYDYVNAKTAENAVLMTRGAKRVLSKEVLQEKWLKECKEIGFDIANAPGPVNPNPSLFDRLKREVQNLLKSLGLERDNESIDKTFATFVGEQIPYHKREKLAADFFKREGYASAAEHAVQYAIAHLGERSAVFEKRDLQMLALRNSIGSTNITSIDDEIQKRIDEKKLLPSKNYSSLLTTRDALHKEEETIALARGALAHGQKPQIYTKGRCNQLLAGSTLGKDQKIAAALILTSKQRVVCIQGYAGTGKTFMLSTARNLAEKEGYNFIGLAPSSSAANTLRTQAEIPSQTLQKFLYKYKGLLEGRGTIEGRKTMQEELKDKVIILDESSLASTSQLHALMKISKELDVKVALVGDVKQLGAVEVGKPFYQLQKAGIDTAVMEDIKRQTNKELRSAVFDAIKAVDHKDAEKFISKAIEKINIIECERKDFAMVASEEWLKNKALIVAPSKQLRSEVNSGIRQKLQGTLVGPAETFIILDDRSLTVAEKTLAKNYYPGEQVLFNKTYPSLGIIKGQYCMVVGVQAPNGVKLQTSAGRASAGRTLLWDPQKMSHVDVFGQRQIEMQCNDQIRWTKNFKRNEINNSDTATIVSLTATDITLKSQTGQIMTFNRSDNVLKHMDHAYAATVSAVQGKTDRGVIGALDSTDHYLTNQRAFYIILSRAKEFATLITDNKENLIKTLSINAGIKTSASEHSEMPTNEEVLEKKPKLSFFEKLHIDFQDFYRSLGLARPCPISEKSSVIEQAMQYAISHLSERSTVIETKTLEGEALKRAMGFADMHDISQEIAKLESTKQLLPNGTSFTTREALLKEKKTIELAVGTTDQLYTKDQCNQLLAKSSLTKGQKSAASLILTTEDRVVCVQGYAGTGKTFMLDTARQLAEEKGYSLIGLAPSSSAANTLRLQAKIPAQTLHKFLFKYKNLLEGKETVESRGVMKAMLQNKIIVLDESSLAATSQVYVLLSIAKELNVRVVFVGDVKQLGAVEAGKPFYQLQKAGVKTAVMDDIKRQTNPRLRSAVLDSIKVLDGFTCLIPRTLDNINCIESSAFADTAAKEWFKLNGKGMIIAPSKKLREEVNEHIRNILIDLKQLKGDPWKCTILDNKNLTKAAKTLALNYSSGNKVLFNKDYISIGVKKGEYCFVAGPQKYNLVKLQKTSGETFFWNPQKMPNVEVFEQECIAIRQNEHIRWTKNFGSINNSDTAKVIAMTDKHVTFQLQTGHTKIFDKTDPILKHMNYAYAATVHAAEGKTTKNIIGILLSKHKHLTNQRMLYVMLSRAKESATLITDSVEKLTATLAVESGVKTSAAEHQNIKLKI